MQVPEHYISDVQFFFDGNPLELALYQTLAERMAETLPDDVSVKVQKSQISFYARRLFAAASLPVRRKKDWPRECLVVTVGLDRPLNSPPVRGVCGALSRPLDQPHPDHPPGGGGWGADGVAAGGPQLRPEKALKFTLSSRRTNPALTSGEAWGIIADKSLSTWHTTPKGAVAI